MERFEAIVRGKVQGVWFRAFVFEQALALGLRGETRNLSDGSVAVVAEGSHEKLELLLEHLWRGPELAQVDTIDVDWKDARGTHETFSIAH